VRVLLSLTGPEPSGDEFEQLCDWLSRERELQGLITNRTNPPGPDKMGGLTDVLSIALASGGAISVLAASLKVWFAQPRREDVRVTIRTADGDTVEIDARRVASAEAILTAFIRDRRTGSVGEDD
jgi:hypothetical protein